MYRPIKGPLSETMVTDETGGEKPPHVMISVTHLRTHCPVRQPSGQTKEVPDARNGLGPRIRSSTRLPFSVEEERAFLEAQKKGEIERARHKPSLSVDLRIANGPTIYTLRPDLDVPCGGKGTCEGVVFRCERRCLWRKIKDDETVGDENGGRHKNIEDARAACVNDVGCPAITNNGARWNLQEYTENHWTQDTNTGSGESEFLDCALVPHPEGESECLTSHVAVPLPPAKKKHMHRGVEWATLVAAERDVGDLSVQIGFQNFKPPENRCESKVTIDEGDPQPLASASHAACS